eukprot:6185294-Pleurochrysis_carterae.AAC.3
MSESAKREAAERGCVGVSNPRRFPSPSCATIGTCASAAASPFGVDEHALHQWRLGQRRRSHGVCDGGERRRLLRVLEPQRAQFLLSRLRRGKNAEVTRCKRTQARLAAESNDASRKACYQQQTSSPLTVNIATKLESAQQVLFDP